MTGRVRSVWLIAAAVVANNAGTPSTAAPRLFPDMALRFRVGDQQAANPVSNTEGPKTLLAHDLNRDGLADVIAGNLDGSISVLLGRTNNTLSEQILTPAAGLLTNCSLRALAVADFNRDGHSDVAAADIASGSVVVLHGNGTGALTPFRRVPVGPARALAAADFNRDGNPDLLVACSPPDCEWCSYRPDTNANQRLLCILDGLGDGSFAAPRYLLEPGTPACFYDVAAADMDGDGDPDVLALDFSYCAPTTSGGLVFRTRRLQIFANDGAGGFAADAPDRVLEMSGEGPRAFQVAYLDDRIVGGTYPPGASLDIIVANRDSSTLDVFCNLGGLNFTSPKSFHAGDTPRDVAVGDLDGDGYADLVVVNRDANTVSVMRGLGGGAFAPPSLEFPAGVSPRQVALADFNGDGALDAAVNNRISEDLSLFVGRHGLAGFLVSDNWYRAGYNPVSVVAEDFNHDGYPDVATANLRSHDIRVRLNQRDGKLANEVVYAVNQQPAILATGDLNRDGHLDLAVTCLGSGLAPGAGLGGSLVVLTGRGDGTFDAPLSTSLGITALRPFWLRLGDLDTDGQLDAAIGGVRGELALLRGLGNGSFAPGVTIGDYPDGRPLGLALGDFDADGTLDIATSRGMVLLNDGHFFDGSHRTNYFWLGPTTRFTSGSQAWATEADDLDGDGVLDLMLALTFRRPDPIGVLYGLGQARFTEPDIYEGPDVGAVALVGQDMDGDNLKDIVVGNRCAATVIILRGLDDRLFNYGEIINAYSVEDVAVADMNRDGRPDIVGVGGGLWVLISGSQLRLVEPTSAQVAGMPERPGPFLNELMAFNQEFHVTNGLTPDWVEIYNHGNQTQDMTGWSLIQVTIDGVTNRWTFSATNPVVIPPSGHAVIYCKKKSSGLPGVYASFELSADGENVGLLDPGGATVDFVSFPPLPADVSYARIFDGARYFSYNPSPSLGTANHRPRNLAPSAERKDPYVGPGASCLGLNARLFDDVAIAYAALCYRPAGGGDFSELPLNDDGLHGDKLPADGYFGALLPPLPAGGTLEYFFRAVDLEGELATSPDNPENPANLHRITVPAAAEGLRLTELMADNRSGLRDETGSLEDWVELANTGTEAVCLDGLALAKDYYGTTGAWPFPPGRCLQPGERLVVFCDDDLTQGPLHSSFKLLRSGDRLFLLRTNGWEILDSLSYGPLPSDTSFGVLGSSTNAHWLAWPTPAAENLPMPLAEPEALPPRFFWRIGPDPTGGVPMITLRWLGSTNAYYSVYGSTDLHTWVLQELPATHLGDGLFQWTTPVSGDTRLFRLRRQ